MLRKIEIPSDYCPKVYVTAHGKKWQWKYKLPDGSWYYCSAGSNEKHAKKNAELKARDLLKGLFNEHELTKMSHSLSISESVARYLTNTGMTKTGETKRGEVPLIKSCFDFFVKRQRRLLTDILESDVLAYRDYLVGCVSIGTLKPISASNKLKAVKKVFRWFKVRKEILIDPSVDIEAIKVTASEKARSVTFSHEQLNKLFLTDYRTSTGFDVKSFALLIYATGLRPGEVRHLEWNDIDFASRTLTLRCKANCPTVHQLGWKPKNGKERQVPLNDVALEVLRKLPIVPSVGFIKGDSKPYPANFVFVLKNKHRGGLDKAPWQRVDNLRHAWRELLKAAGLWSKDTEGLIALECPFTRHDLRRTFSAHAKQSGISALDTSAILGHSETVNLQHYSEKANVSGLHTKIALHPSNHLKLVPSSPCCNSVAEHSLEPADAMGD